MVDRMPLRLLLIDDSPDDALLVVLELNQGGYDVTSERVDTAAALSEALERGGWDAITCDWVMPRFSAPAALELIRERHCEVPVIVVSGQVGEEVAATAMRAGAHDYVSKSKLARLVPPSRGSFARPRCGGRASAPRRRCSAASGSTALWSSRPTM